MSEMIAKSKFQIRKALEDSKEYLKTFPKEYREENGCMSTDDFKKFLESFAVRVEICTLNWVLGDDSVLNCYKKETDGSK